MPELTVKAAGWAASRGNETVTSSVEMQVPLLIVHLKTYVDPFVPVKVLPGTVGVAIVPPLPLAIVHKPVPETGGLAARVALVAPQRDWSVPAFAVVGTG